MRWNTARNKGLRSRGCTAVTVGHGRKLRNSCMSRSVLYITGKTVRWPLKLPDSFSHCTCSRICCCFRQPCKYRQFFAVSSIEICNLPIRFQRRIPFLVALGSVNHRPCTVLRPVHGMAPSQLSAFLYEWLRSFPLF